MAQPTLLELTQNILSRLDSDSVNSISDTVESLRVANIIKNKYYDILSRGDLPQQEVLFQLDASGDSTKPTLMYIPDTCSKIKWIKYFDTNPLDSATVSQFGAYSHGVNTDLATTGTFTTTSSTSNSIGAGTKTFTVASSSLPIVTGQGVICVAGTNSMFGTVTSYTSTTLVIETTSYIGSGTYTSWTITNSDSLNIPGYRYVKPMPVEDFIEMVNRFNPSETNVRSYTFTEGSNSFNLYYKNDIQPYYYTVIENNYVLFDTYDSTYDSTLQASKTLVYGQKITAFSLTDSHVPDIDDNQFPLLLNEATALAFFELKQTPHIKAEQEIKRQWSTVQKDKSILDKPSYLDQLPNFGRNARRSPLHGKY